MRRHSFLFVLLFLMPFGLASAHTSSDSFLSVEIEGQTIRGEWAISLRDLEFALGIDQNGDGKIVWRELEQKRADIEQLASAALRVSVPGEHCPLTVTDLQVDRRSDGNYAFLALAGSCAKPIADGVPVTAEYSLFFSNNPQHRGIARFRFGENQGLWVFSPETRRLIVSRQPEPSSHSSFLQLFIEGVWHIWIGFDHILFLLALLFPAVLMRRDDGWQPVESFAPAFISVLKVVTAFTVAHSITLALASLRIITLPSRMVETAIAFSVFLAAANNLFHAVEERRLWWVAFIFGLIHGFGFANVMADFGLQGSLLLSSILSFNLGVEAGQLAIVSVFLPLAYFIRGGAFYRRVVFFGGSAATALVALHWTVDRFLGMN